ncbi:M16 family metallopeptidase [Rosettibacter firmus]|uniref:M16 family metallopeptidase n=1 Tax=Rosettibacter firmus TaxID=3111522 RepID=UPI00336BD4B5
MNNKILKINYEKYKLPNGLEVILYQDKSLPIVAVNIWYRVGSANESKGKTGFAHLFEHMMFQGSKHVPKGEHFRLIQEAGGTLNGSTSFDRTNYFETLPSNYLELALWLESDRMGFLLPALTEEKLINQKDVVMNERRQRYENQPYGLAWEILLSNLFTSDHPYSWPTIGWMEDIQNFKLDDVIKFFKTYYSPNNATLAIGGNFDFNNATKLIETYFGEIPSIDIIPEVKSPEQKLISSKKIIHEDNVQLPRIYLAWHTDKIFGQYDSSLDILSDILTSSKNARLTKSLVYDKQISQDVTSFQYSGKYGGMFLIISTAKPESTLEEIKNEIFEQINLVIKKGIEEEELIRSKNSIKSHYIYSLQKLDVVVDHINQYNFYLNEPDSFMFDLNRYESVNPNQIIEVAQKFLNQPYVELNIIPKRNK